MPSARIAFAGLSPLCEQILRAGLARRPDIELVTPWTRLSSLGTPDGATAPETLLIELERPHLPPALRALLSAAASLRIVALSPDARSATVFRLVEERTFLFDCEAQDLCSVLDSPV